MAELLAVDDELETVTILVVGAGAAVKHPELAPLVVHTILEEEEFEL